MRCSVMPEGHSCMRPSSPRVMLPTILAIGLFWTALAGAAPTVGFIEEWPGTSLSTWSGGTPDFNPGTGGFLGAGDGYLGLSNTFLGQFGTTSAGLEYAGNWQAAGITHVFFSLNNLTTNDPIEIHFGIGRDVHTVSPNFWQYNIGVIPPVNAWKQFDVDLTSANFTRIICTGTLDDALKNVQRIHLRHDQAPFAQSPNPIIGDMGIDHLMLANSPLAVGSAPGVTTGRPVQLAPPAP